MGVAKIIPNKLYIASLIFKKGFKEKYSQISGAKIVVFKFF